MKHAARASPPSAGGVVRESFLRKATGIRTGRLFLYAYEAV